MIIYGTRGITSTHASGQFYCPQCGSGSHYTHRRVRRFFTLYFIPLIPLDMLGEYVECGSCAGTYKPGVLELDPDADRVAFEAEFSTAVRHVAIKMLLADGVIDDTELEELDSLLVRLTKHSPGIEALRAQAEQTREDATSIQAYVAGIRGSLNDNGKELIVRAALAIASADGTVTDEERILLVQIGEALELTEAHLMGILQAAAEA